MERLAEDHDNVPDISSTSQSSVSSEPNDSTNSRPHSLSTEDGESSSDTVRQMQLQEMTTRSEMALKADNHYHHHPVHLVLRQLALQRAHYYQPS